MNKSDNGGYLQLIDELHKSGYITTPSILRAFCKVARAWFLPTQAEGNPGYDEPISIGFGQTNSQPLTVAIMMELLRPQPGQKVLDVGTGSGWTSALLAEMVKPNGLVVSIECVPELVTFARTRLAKAGYPQVIVIEGDGGKGDTYHAPFDRIHVAAGARRVPQALIDQLAPGGRLVIPVGNALYDMLCLTKDQDGVTHEKRIPGFAFVPLITKS